MSPNRLHWAQFEKRRHFEWLLSAIAAFSHQHKIWYPADKLPTKKCRLRCRPWISEHSLECSQKPYWKILMNVWNCVYCVLRGTCSQSKNENNDLMLTMFTIMLTLTKFALRDAITFAKELKHRFWCFREPLFPFGDLQYCQDKLWHQLLIRTRKIQQTEGYW